MAILLLLKEVIALKSDLIKRLLLLLLLMPMVSFSQNNFKSDMDKFGFYSGRLLAACHSLKYAKDKYCSNIKLNETNTKLCLGYITMLLPEHLQEKSWKAFESLTFAETNEIADDLIQNIFKSNSRIEDLKKRNSRTCKEFEKVIEGDLTKSLSILKGINTSKFK